MEPSSGMSVHKLAALAGPKPGTGVALFSWTPKIAWIGRGCSLERWG